MEQFSRILDHTGCRGVARTNTNQPADIGTQERPALDERRSHRSRQRPTQWQPMSATCTQPATGLSYSMTSSMTGMVRSVPAWYSAKFSMAAACRA